LLNNFYSKLSEQERKIFYIAVGAAVLALFDALVFRPYTTKKHAIDIEIREKVVGIKNSARFLSYQDKILQEEQLYSPYLQQEPEDEQKIIAGFLETIENLA